MNSAAERSELRIMTLITEYKDALMASSILESNGIPVQFICKGEGTASNELLDYLGLVITEKAVLLSLVPLNQVSDLFSVLHMELHLNKPGKGIAFTFPITGINSLIIKLFNDETQQRIIEHMERSENQMSSEVNHGLLITIINQGYSEEVMNAAKEAGATGGTVLHARRLGSEEVLKRWGIGIQQEKEMVFILIEKKKKHDIMKAIGEKCGLHTEAQGIVVSIPVDAVTGLENTPIKPLIDSE